MAYIKKEYIKQLYLYSCFLLDMQDYIPNERKAEYVDKWVEYTRIINTFMSDNKAAKERTREYIAERRKTDKNYARTKKTTQGK